MQVNWNVSPRSKPGVKYNNDGAIVTGTPRQILDMLTACALSLHANDFDVSGLRREVIALKKEMDARYEADNGG